MVLAQTELKRNEDLDLSFLDDILRDIVTFYATFFTEGDRRQAKDLLEKKTSIDSGELAQTFFWFGGSIFISLLLIV